MDADRIYTKLDIIEERISSIDRTLAVNTEQLSEHMRRSLANEKAVELLAKDLIPIKNHVSNVTLIGKILALLLTSGGFIAGVLKYLLVR